MGNRDLGIRALGYWYAASQMQMRGVSFADATAYYDQAHPTFIVNLGGAITDGRVTDSKVREAMQNLAYHGIGKYPDQSSFFGALIDQVNSFTYQDFKDVVSQTAGQVATVAKVGASLYVVGLGVALGLFLLLEHEA